MARRFVLWAALVVLLALPRLAAAQYYWEVRDDATRQVIYPTGTVSVFEDITYPTVAQRRYLIKNTASYQQQIGPCSIIGDQSFVIGTYPYFPPQTSSTVPAGLSTTMTVQHLAYTPGTQEATVQCFVTTGVISFRVRGRVLDANPYIILETPKGENIPKNSTFDFGSTQTGTPLDQDFRIINLGNQTLAVSLSVTGSAYSVVTPPPANILKGSEATFRLRLLSATSGKATGQLVISNNDPNDNPYAVNLSGEVSAPPAPQIRITDNGNAGAIVAKGSTINIGSTPANTPLNRTFTITNIGNATLSINNPTSFLNGAGYIIASSPSSSISQGSNTIFTVRFQAATAGTYTGTVSLQSNDSDDNPFSFNLQATVSPTVPRIRIVDQTTGQTIVPGSTTISFGNPAPNTVVPHTFRIYNDGTAPLTLSNPGSFVSGNGFTLSSPPSSPVAAGGSTPFFINFQGSSTGSYSGAADLGHNDTAVANPFHFGLQANVVAPQSTVTLAASDPEASETAPNGGQFTLTRTGSTALPLTVNLSRSGSAIDGTDYSSIAATQTFAAGQSTLYLALSPIDDAVIEDVETVTLALAAGSGYVAGSPSSGTVSITNNDFTACTPSATRLCLQGGRFEATLTAVANSVSYTGQTLVLSDNSGGFWLFSPANIEVSVKVLDGAAVNGRFWVFHGAATDVAYTLTVNDRANASRLRTFTKPAGTFCGGADTTTAFPKSLARRRTAALDFDADLKGSFFKAFTCVPDAFTTCLLGNRFQVRVKQGTTYRQVVPVTSQTGFFWFYSPDNTEIFFKVLDGTPLNAKYWVFFGSMTDQGYTIEVTDSTTGILKSYASPGAFCGNADTSAF